MDVVVVAVVALLVFALVLVGALVLCFRALDKRASARDGKLVEAVDRLTQTVAASLERHGDDDAGGAPRGMAVKLGPEIVELDADMVARLEKITGELHAGGASTALARALARGFEAVERARAEDRAASGATRPVLRVVKDAPGEGEDRSAEGGAVGRVRSEDGDDDDDGGPPAA